MDMILRKKEVNGDSTDISDNEFIELAAKNICKYAEVMSNSDTESEKVYEAMANIVALIKAVSTRKNLEPSYIIEIAYHMDKNKGVFINKKNTL